MSFEEKLEEVWRKKDRALRALWEKEHAERLAGAKRRRHREHLRRLRFEEGMSYRQIAAETGRSATSARRLILEDGDG